MKLPDLDPIAAAIDAAHESREESPRLHLGASMLGHHCDRWLWLSFRWAVREKFSGRMLRLFRRGQLEEATIVQDLRAIGIDIGSTGGAQARVSFGKHVSGSIDGIIESGVPGAPNTRHVAEFKTHSKKSFDELARDGVEKAKPMHWCQMQVYMHGKGIDRALYVAVCKDDDRIHSERIRYDEAAATALVERGQRITMTERMPEPCPGAGPDWYQCKFCAAYDFCHKTHLATEVNCRTCAHVTPLETSFRCERWAQDVPTEVQPLGCDCHVAHPDLVPWKMLDSDSQFIARWLIDGVTVANGEPAERVYRTREIIANPEYCKAPTEQGEALRMLTFAEVVSA
jgi:hypothetical protein